MGLPRETTSVLTKASDAVGKRGAPESGGRPRLGVAGEEVRSRAQSQEELSPCQGVESRRAVPERSCLWDSHFRSQ